MKADSEIMIHLNISGQDTSRKWECEKAEKKELDEIKQKKSYHMSEKECPVKKYR